MITFSRGEQLRILFLEMDDAARSQMAAGLLRHLGGDAYDVCSAGPFPAPWVSPEAVEVMREIGLVHNQAAFSGMER